MGRRKELDNLSMDMIQCEKDGFGVNYGRWKPWHDAQKEEQEKPPEKIEPEVIVKRICENCGVEFVRHDKRQRKYCCDACREAANHRMEQERKHNNGQA